MSAQPITPPALPPGHGRPELEPELMDQLAARVSDGWQTDGKLHPSRRAAESAVMRYRNALRRRRGDDFRVTARIWAYRGGWLIAIIDRNAE